MAETLPHNGPHPEVASHSVTSGAPARYAGMLRHLEACYPSHAIKARA